jgi:crotonobetainyl-CoA:carnitine CoA-transferase CaiB-like acyl-CoA transferase
LVSAEVFGGPHATLLMAKAGADVVKIEPTHGETLRRARRAAQEHDLPNRLLNSKYHTEEGVARSSPTLWSRLASHQTETTAPAARRRF